MNELTARAAAAPLGELGAALGIGFGVSLLLAAALQLFPARLQPGIALRWMAKHSLLLLFQALLAESVLGILLALTGSYAAGAVLGLFLLLMLGYVNSLMLYYRRQPLVPRDLVMALNLNQLIAMVSPLMVGLAVLALAGAAGGCALLLHFFPQPFWPGSLRVRLLAGCVLVFALFVFAEWEQNPLRWLLERCGGNFHGGRDSYGSYDRNGWLIAFCSQLGSPLMPAPKGYRREPVRDIAEEYQQKAAARNKDKTEDRRPPHVVFVMSEAFSDPLVFESLRFRQDPIAGIRQVMEGCVHGRALAPGYGGGTAHCEFEALTGFSIALCGGASPYESVVRKKPGFPGVTRRLKEQGYRTIALHPYTDAMYARPRVYESMGFDAFVVEKTMKHTGKIDGNPYVSDRAAYDEVLELLDREDSPCFVHLVTMQNHGEYRTGRYKEGIPAEGMEGKKAGESMEVYARGLAHTDEATCRFLEELKGRDRDTVVLFWGDHLPVGYPDKLVDEIGSRRFETPFFLWTSRENKRLDLGTRSPFLFPALLAKGSGGPLTPFEILLEELGEGLHGLQTAFCLDGTGEEQEKIPGEAYEALRKYRLIQYDVLLGEGAADELGFFSLPKASGGYGGTEE